MDIQNKLTEAEIRFKIYHNRLRVELNNANWHFVIHQLLDRFREEYKDEMTQAPIFFGLTQRSHFLDTIMRLNKICDYDKDTLNIHKLLNFAEQNIEIFSDKSFERRKSGSVNYDIAMRMHNQNPNKIDAKFLSEHREKYAAFSDSNLKKLRDKVIAHIDKDVVLKEVLPFKEYEVEASQMEAIINDLDETLNLLSIAYDGNEYAKNLGGLDNRTKFVMDLIRVGLKEYKNNPMEFK